MFIDVVKFAHLSCCYIEQTCGKLRDVYEQTLVLKESSIDGENINLMRRASQFFYQ